MKAEDIAKKKWRLGRAGIRSDSRFIVWEDGREIAECDTRAIAVAIAALPQLVAACLSNLREYEGQECNAEYETRLALAALNPKGETGEHRA